MKRIPLIILIACFLLLNACVKTESNKKFSYSPEKPFPGDEITVSYNPTGTVLENAKKISLIAYFYTKGNPETKEFPTKKEKNQWIASFATDKKTRGIIIKFQEEENIDNNNKQGYIITLYGKDGKQIPGELAGLAEAYLSWGRYFIGLEAANELALSKFEEDFKINPEIKREYLGSYLSLLVSLRKKDANETILKELDEIAGKEDLSLEELTMMVSLYRRINQPEKAEKYSQMIRQKDPKGDFVQAERFGEFYRTREIDKKLALLESFKKDFPASPRLKMLHTYICYSYQERGEYAKIKEYLEKNPDAADFSLYNSIAWDMVQKGLDLKLAEEFASKAVELARKEKENPSLQRPSYYTEREWQENLEVSLGMILDTYAFILLKLDRTTEALPAFEEAVRLTREKNSEINERYAEALVKSGASQKALSELEKFIKAGESTAKMKDLYKQAYLKVNANETEANRKLKELEEVGREKLKAELKKQMIDSPAADFTLQDLGGNSVLLSGLKGKVVILDFWATWCGPCLTSFPGMKMAVEKFKEDKTVEFLFINSWERVSDWKKNASEFITKNNYPFHVLLDTENKVITAYKVEGIPTKFVIDKKGRIRFQSIGFSGNTEKLVEELSLMIEILH